MSSLSLSSILPAPKNSNETNRQSGSNELLTEGDTDNVQLVEKVRRQAQISFELAINK